MINKINNQQDFARMLAQEKAVLSFYIEWSLYSSADGMDFFEKAELFFVEQNRNDISFCLADVSEMTPIATFVFDWMTDFDETGRKLRLWVGCGNPSVLWLKSGNIVDYEFSAYHLKTEGIIRETSKNFEL